MNKQKLYFEKYQKTLTSLNLKPQNQVSTSNDLYTNVIFKK